MTNTYNNDGSAISAENINDVTIYHYSNVPSAGSTNAIVSPNVPPRKISFKPVPEPHGAFIGRVEYVKSAIKYLSQPVTTDCQIQFPFMVIHALGGYGKTETAMKIASRCRKKRKFQHFIWIDSEDDVSIKKGFVEPMNEIGLAATDKNVGSLMRQFYDRLLGRKNEKFLIIFDNVEDFNNILNYLPLNYRASNIAVLMTSRHRFTRESYGKVNNQRLDLMPQGEAIQLVEKILGRSSMDSEQDKKLLVEQSGRIALLLRVMTTTIKFQRKSKPDYRIEQYLEEMSDQPAQYSDTSNALELNYDKSLQTIVRFAVDKLRAGGPIGLITVKIFDRLAYCSASNELTNSFVYSFLLDICEEAKNVDLKLPFKPTYDLQIIRMAVGKLSEFSLAQFGDSAEFSVHRWIQASRRLDLKESGDERKVLKELLFNAPDMENDDINGVSIWQHVADYADLVNEFYAKNRTFLHFPRDDIDLLEKILRGLTPPANPNQLKHFSEEIHGLVLLNIFRSSAHAVERIVNVFNFDVTKNSEDYLKKAIYGTNLDVIKWLINEKALIPAGSHLRLCFRIAYIEALNPNCLKKLKKLNVKLGERTENNCEKNPFECICTAALNKLRSLRLPWTSPCIEIREISYILSALDDLNPFKIGLCEIIEKSCGENVLDYLLHSETHELTEDSMNRTSECIKEFEIITVISRALQRLVPTAELSAVLETYSERNLLECLFICGRPHPSAPTKVVSFEEFRDLHQHSAAWRNDLKAINLMDPTLIESTTKSGLTPLMCASLGGKCETATVLLEKFSANANAMDNDGWTPLAYAIENRSPAMVEILLRHGAKTCWKTESGVTVHALHNAVRFYCYYDNFESKIIESVLTSDDCDVCAIDLDGNNILHLLVKYYYATSFEPDYLVLYQPSISTLVNMQNNDGLTPLQLAKTIQARFSDSHWHAKNLTRFISKIDKVCESDDESWDSYSSGADYSDCDL